MNLVLHGIEDFQIAREDTLRDPAGRSRGWRSGAPSTLCAPAPGLPAHRRAPQTAVIGRALHGGCTAPPLPAQRGSAEHAVGGAAQHRALAPLRIDPQLEVQALPVEHAQAVADPVVPAVLRRGEADPRRPHEPAPHRQPVTNLAVEPVALREAAVRHARHRLPAPQRLGPALRLPAPRRRHPRHKAQRRRRRRVVAQRHGHAPLPEPLGLVHQQRPHPHVALLHRSGRERNPPMVVAEVCSSMKYPKRCQYKHAKQKKYHVRNWAEYNEGLRRRGDLTVWFDEEAIANWKADKTGKPGGQRVYSDMAIETGLVVRMVYKLAYRQTEGFLHSIASLLGLGIEIPDYSTLCRRSRLLRKKLRIPKAASTQPIHLMIDSTGLRIHVGNARKPPKQRAWRKLHIAVDRETGNIVASELTASRARDATRVPALLTQIQAPLVSVAADSAYDKEAVYEAIEAHSPGRRTRVVIPPQRNTTLSQNSNTAMQERDRHIRAIERHGRREWYKLSGYTKRSMVENAVYRYKAIIGPEMRARTLARQRVEHRIGCEILNKMAALGMPDTYCAE